MSAAAAHAFLIIVRSGGLIDMSKDLRVRQLLKPIEGPISPARSRHAYRHSHARADRLRGMATYMIWHMYRLETVRDVSF